MAKTKNEIRERNGKVVLVVCISFFLLIIGFYGLILIVFTNATKDVAENLAKTKKINEIEKDTVSFPSFMIEGKQNLFVGGEKKGEIQIVNGIKIEATDSMTLNYKIDFLENWKKVDQIKGIARLDINSVKKDTFIIERQNGRAYFAYKFIDETGKCNLEILISKSEYSSSSIAQVRENCEDNIENITPILFYK